MAVEPPDHDVVIEECHHADQTFIRLGAGRWQWLHRLIYLPSVLGVAHFWWLVRKDVSEPLVFAVLLAALFIIRLLYLLVQQRSRPRLRPRAPRPPESVSRCPR